jgi:hypothetical protein
MTGVKGSRGQGVEGKNIKILKTGFKVLGCKWKNLKALK